MVSREIKFRAWDKKDKCFRVGYIEDKSIWGDGGVILKISFDGKVIAYTHDDGGKSGLWEHELTEYQDRFELMQYTGLKDKNGKEIYEGDILTGCPYCLDPMIVYWDKGQCGYELKSTSKPETYCHFLDYSGEADYGRILWEVIGNIYENSELINKEVK